MAQAKKNPDSDQRELTALRHIRNAIRSIRHGTVTIIVQDGIVIQIDRTEKQRIDYSDTMLHKDGDGI